jgi:hypothetical protein
MLRTQARVTTTHGGKYVQQLCKHWAHKLDVTLTQDEGIVRFPDAVATMSAEADALSVTIEAADAATLERMQDVVARHLDRFAFREAPLPFAWSPAA